MRWHRDRSIRLKLQGIVMVTCIVALVVASVLFTIENEKAGVRFKIFDLTASSEMIGSNSTAALTFGDAIAAKEILRAFRARQDVIHASIYDQAGKVFATYSRDSRDASFTPPAPQLEGSAVVGNHLNLFHRIELDGEPLGVIFVEADFSEIHERMMQFLKVEFFASLISLTVAFVLASRLQRVVSGPIQELANTASSVSTQQNYSIRAKKRSNDEIGLLFDQFNEMLERIEQRDAALRKAHDELELRVDERTRELQKEVAERRQAESQLEQRTIFLNSVIENSPVAIASLTPDGAIQLCNPAFEHLFGYPQRDAIGMSGTDLLPPDQAQAEAETIANGIRKLTPVHMTTRRKRKDGSLVDVELFRAPVVQDAVFTGTLALYQDITERKRAEKALLQGIEAAEAASRAKSEFLANMSHEIRTPMNGIIGMTELVLDTKLDEEQRDYLNLAKLSADSLLTLLNDILDYSKIEAGKLEVDSIDFNLGASLGDTMKTLSLRAHQKGLELAFEIDPQVPDALVGDPGRLRQVIVNLVGNAIKFTDRGEVVLFVKAEWRTDSDVLLQFTVADTGIGVAKDKQAAIFEAFQQADGSMTRKYGGTGLGLTISSRLVSLMGGRIWVESDLGKGSRFHFTIRYAVQKSSARTMVPRDPVSLKDMRVLVVDDNGTNRYILAKMLTRWHMKPVSVECGAKAIITLREAEGLGRVFPLILLDAQMPEMDGFALAAAIKQNPHWRTATVMMLSSAGQRGDALRCRELGIAAYLTKPVSQDELLDAILNALVRPNEAATPLVTRHSLREVHKPALRILLAEDNTVNQTLAVRLLEKNGHRVTVAENGALALETLEKQPFDLILMDVQMPVMNGWEATQAIRKKEAATNAHIPIIAMTAHAMKGDEERCLASGMDAYLTKPIRTQELLDLLEKMGGAATMSAQSKTTSLKEEKEVLDIQAALNRLDGDRELLEEIARLFIDGWPKARAGIERAWKSQDAGLVERLAHSLKGSSANLSAHRVSSAASELEMQARSGDLTLAGEQILELAAEVERLRFEVEKLLGKVVG